MSDSIEIKMGINYIMLLLVWLEAKTHICFGFGFWILYVVLYFLYSWCWKKGYIKYVFNKENN
jgi:hypothetical protein